MKSKTGQNAQITVIETIIMGNKHVLLANKYSYDESLACVFLTGGATSFKARSHFADAASFNLSIPTARECR